MVTVQPAGMGHVELEGVDELSAGVFRAFLTALRLYRQLTIRSLGEHQAHPGQAICLHLLSANDGVTQRDLAAALHVAPPTLSRMLGSLEKSGLVERRPDAADQRLTRVFFTDDGRVFEKEMRLVTAANVRETVATLPEDDRRELERLLLELAQAMARAVEARSGAAAEAAGEPRA
jgi:DNA-binding MarR family transcriptional regulator